jgi:hypothetical protein
VGIKVEVLDGATPEDCAAAALNSGLMMFACRELMRRAGLRLGIHYFH